MPSITKYTLVCPVRSDTTDCSYRYIIHDKHDHCKNRQRQDSVCNDFIDLIRQCHTICRAFFLQTFSNDGCNVCIALVGDDTLGVIIHFFLTCFDICLDRSGGNTQLLLDLFITLKQLDRIPSLLLLRLIGKQCLFDIFQCRLYRCSKLVRRQHLSATVCCFHCCIGNLCNAGTFQR